ncbi:hypothetical protein GKG47_10755 [Lactonifactor sp. BIOML-A3]|uniref:DUF6674 family protein n=1 Tax=unclassified Lactonifactor TaxID=2636670 RepID=UPI0012B13697|nr:MULTISPECIES: DUF6674 family protein [unclassified Lactonifactor]MSA02008.1 hypothetical protein [Lactonifactor sp. BIOML-A5]MSA08522.1 hypothetical protein [Lactonifactor sp. BIOML-A4]MSA12909.1 hypothetical protein [Lactonifactor sp. BIOML-A3]MSA17589.1 hypothetical protein [Lactonifactor sp. BIOML-A2]MSA37121.1 hypothetical protein [Lactonifactor sp. BIOML-A1]
MAEPAIALREHPQIVELFTVLEQNGLHQQKDEVQALVNYIDGMEDKLSRMVDEMTAMRKEVDRLHDKSIQAKCTYLMNTAENKVCQVRNMVSTAKSNTISAAGRMVQTFHEKGRAALRHAVQALRVPAVLTRMEHGFSHASKTMEQCAGRMDMMREELHQAGGHLKSAGRALVGKDAQQVKELDADKGALAKLRGFLTSCGKAFSEMERGAGRLAEKAGGEKSSVKTELTALKAVPSGQHRTDPGKDKAR